jgi:hypothetical protein
MSEKSNNICFIHIATLGNYQNIVDEIFSYIDKNSFSKIIANIAGDHTVLIPEGVEIIPERSLLEEYEFSTLNIIRDYCKENENINVLYIHTKGASVAPNICIDEWRQYMLYYNLKNIPKIEQILTYYDACGVDLVSDPVLHFSGNFWWSKAKHINTLLPPTEVNGVFSERHKCEFWICSNVDSKYTSLHNSNISVYERHLTRYPREKYERHIN